MHVHDLYYTWEEKNQTNPIPKHAWRLSKHIFVKIQFYHLRK